MKKLNYFDVSILSVAMAILLALFVTGCTQPGQNRYGYADVGKATQVEFGQIIAMKEVQITGRNTGAGALVGGAAGMGAGAYVGGGTGRLWGSGVGALAGLLIGGLAEQAISDHNGMEYTVTINSGDTRTIVQNIVEGDAPLHIGQRVTVQVSGQYQRVMPADTLPTEIKRPKKVKVVDDTAKASAGKPKHPDKDWVCSEEARSYPGFIGPMPVDCN
jgi:outer membrane lipoprotein SlyB